MKIKILALILCLLPIAAWSQGDSDETQKISETVIGKLINSKSALSVKDIYDIGAIDNFDQKIKVDAVFVYQYGGHGKKARGLRIEIEELLLKYSASTYLDIDEVENLVVAIGNMQKIIADWNTKTRKAYTEVKFSSRDNFSIGFYQTPQNMDNKGERSFTDRLLSKNMNIDGNKKMFISIGYLKKANYLSDLSELAEVKRLIEKGLVVLNAEDE